MEKLQKNIQEIPFIQIPQIRKVFFFNPHWRMCSLVFFWGTGQRERNIGQLPPIQTSNQGSNPQPWYIP